MSIEIRPWELVWGLVALHYIEDCEKGEDRLKLGRALLRGLRRGRDQGHVEWKEVAAELEFSQMEFLQQRLGSLQSVDDYCGQFDDLMRTVDQATHTTGLSRTSVLFLHLRQVVLKFQQLDFYQCSQHFDALQLWLVGSPLSVASGSTSGGVGSEWRVEELRSALQQRDAGRALSALDGIEQLPAQRGLQLAAVLLLLGVDAERYIRQAAALAAEQRDAALIAQAQALQVLARAQQQHQQQKSLDVVKARKPQLLEDPVLLLEQGASYAAVLRLLKGKTDVRSLHLAALLCNAMGRLKERDEISAQLLSRISE